MRINRQKQKIKQTEIVNFWRTFLQKYFFISRYLLNKKFVLWNISKQIIEDLSFKRVGITKKYKFTIICQKIYL